MSRHQVVRSSGHVFVAENKSSRVWFAKWRDADGQHQVRLGPAWVRKTNQHTARGRPVWRTADGPKPSDAYLTPQDAEARLREILTAAPTEARQPEGARTFAEAAEDWMDHGRVKRGLKRSTLLHYRQILNAYVLPGLGDIRLDELTKHRIEHWHRQFPRSRVGETSLMVCRAVLNHAVKLEWIDKNPSQPIELHKRRYSGEYDFYSLEEVLALARAASSEQDAVLYLTAAMSGLRRGELLALTWRDVDFAGQAIRVRRNLSYGELTTPKSGRVRVVPMVAQLAQPLAQLAQRGRFAGDDDFVFGSPTGGPADGSNVRRRYHLAVRRAGLRSLPFHSLRHHFGSMAINKASVIQVQTWMGHSELQTTARYLHHRTQAHDAAMLSGAFDAEARELASLDQITPTRT